MIDNRDANRGDEVEWLIKTPATDPNFKDALERATIAQLREGIMKMSGKKGNKTRIRKCRSRLKQLGAEPTGELEAVNLSEPPDEYELIDEARKLREQIVDADVAIERLSGEIKELKGRLSEQRQLLINMIDEHDDLGKEARAIMPKFQRVHREIARVDLEIYRLSADKRAETTAKRKLLAEYDLVVERAEKNHSISEYAEGSD